MATEEENTESKDKQTAETPSEAGLSVSSASEGAETVEFDGAAPTQLGTERYVHGAFLAAGLGIAFLTSKILAAIWSALTATPVVVKAVPVLLQYAEDERDSLCLVAGAIVGIISVVFMLRRSSIRVWADEVATELYKVHWPDRDTVTNGTIVVLAGGVFATIYVGLLDRLWSFITNLVYGI